ncbi:hypothetical protein ACFWGV_21825, partial [Bacillus subtilis]
MGDLIVVRFMPITAEKLLLKAERDFELAKAQGEAPSVYSVSTFALPYTDEHERLENIIARVCEPDETGKRPASGKNAAVTTKRMLEGEGFPVVLSVS